MGESQCGHVKLTGTGQQYTYAHRQEAPNRQVWNDLDIREREGRQKAFHRTHIPLKDFRKGSDIHIGDSGK